MGPVPHPAHPLLEAADCCLALREARSPEVLLLRSETSSRRFAFRFPKISATGTQKKKGRDVVGCAPRAHPAEVSADLERELVAGVVATAAQSDAPDRMSHLLVGAGWFQCPQKT